MCLFRKTRALTVSILLFLILNAVFFFSTKSLQPLFADQTQDMLATDTTTGSVEDDYEDEWEV